MDSYKKYIWTLWWQGEEQAPDVVKLCFDSMRKHANGAKLVILDQQNIRNYIRLPRNIEEKFVDGGISITHLSDIIRFELLYQHGGLWLDSTIFISEDIPKEIFDYEFYSIKNGTGGDYKNIAKERWTVFLIAGKPGNDVAKGVLSCLYSYWNKYDRLVCYFLTDFSINNTYNTNPIAKKIIDEIPNYNGNVFQEGKGIFYKKSWKIQGGNRILNKIESFVRHLKKLLNMQDFRDWGMEITWYTFLQACTRTSRKTYAFYISKKYNEILNHFLFNETEEIGV